MKKSLIVLFVAILTAILSGCILSKTPNTNDVSMNLGVQKTFSVNVFPSNATYTWTLDGESLPNTEKSYVYTSHAGDHTLVVKATHILGTDTQTWNIQVNIPPTRLIRISAGDAHTVAIKTDGSLWAWGLNWDGELGDGTTTDKHIPTHIGTDTDWVTVATGWDYTMAIKSDGSLWAWGWNMYGRLGDGTTELKLVPTRIGTDTDWVMVDAGGCAYCGNKNRWFTLGMGV